MIKGLYTSAVGMINQMNTMDVVSNNIANVNTTGYKRDMVVSRAFTDELTTRLNDIVPPKKIGKISQGVFVDDIYTDFHTGSITRTDGPLDLALVGEGFFAVSVTDKDGKESTKYTRDGSFTLDQEGTLRTKEGNRVLGQNGPIQIPNGIVTIDQNGRVLVGDEEIDTLRITDFTDRHSLRKFGDNLYDTIKESEEAPFKGTVIQGSLENSNVNSVKEIINVINVAKVYEANQKMVTIHDQILGRTVSDIGRK